MRPVDPGGLNQLLGQGGLHVAVHEVEHGGGGDGGDNQGNQGVIQPYAGNQPQEAQGGHLGGHDQDGHDKGEGGALQLEVVGVDAVGRQGGEVGHDGGAAAGDNQTVLDALQDGDSRVVDDAFEVGEQAGAGQGGEAQLELRMGAGGVDNQDVEEEQTQKRQDNQHHMGQNGSSTGFFVLHYALPPFLARLAADLEPSGSESVFILKTNQQRMALMINRKTDSAPAMP